MAQHDDETTFPYEGALRDVDPRLQDAQSAWLAAIEANTHLDRKTHELIRMVCLAALRNGDGVRRHAQLATEAGASWAELVSALAVAQPAFGLLTAAESFEPAREGFEAAGAGDDA